MANNIGKENTGDYNSGYRNSGYYNSGYRNSGYYNSGDYNSGYRNSGYHNSGNYNSGNYNSGDYNSGYRNSGSFNRDCPKMRLFEKELDMTVEEFYKEYNIYMDLPLNTWVSESDMTKKEKKEYPVYKEIGGYLKTLEYKEACQQWWEENPNDHERFTSLPGFDAEIFKDITGIDVENVQTVNIGEDTIEIEGVKYSIRDIKERFSK